MKREMNLEDKYFNLIKEGNKKVEVRLYDVKRRALNIGDIITFNNRKTNEKIDCLIKDLKQYNSLELLLTEVDTTSEELLSFYTKEEMDKYGLLAIHIELV